MDYTRCICLDHFSEQERRALETELEFTQQVQQALMPQSIPEIPGMSLAVFSRPAQIVSGDYFDFFQFKDGPPKLLATCLILCKMWAGQAGETSAVVQEAVRTEVENILSKVSCTYK